MHGTMLTESEIQRTIKRAELWALTISLACLSGPSIHYHVESIIDGLGFKKWDLLTECAEKNWDLHLKHVKAHRPGKENKAMSKEQQSCGKKRGDG